MKYDIDWDYYRINIYGKPNEIKDWIIALDKVITDGFCMKTDQLDLSDLEKITMAKEFNFTVNQRIYYDNSSILYLPNVTYTAREFLFPILLDNFDKARELIENVQTK